MFPKGVDYLFTLEPRVLESLGCGTLLPVIKGAAASFGSCLPEIRQPSGSLCTVRRCTAGLAQGCHGRIDRKGSLNSSRPLRGFRREGTVIDESPALTVVLQAHARRILAV